MSNEQDNQDPSGKETKDNIVTFEKAKELRDKKTRESQKQSQQKSQQKSQPSKVSITHNGVNYSDKHGLSETNQPMINLPPLTGYLIGAFIVVHLGLTFALDEMARNMTYMNWGFVPLQFKSLFMGGDFTLSNALSPLTHMFMHGSWIHLSMNALMMMAFGAATEKWLGIQKTIFLFLFSGFCGIALQYILDTNNMAPVIGASGGISGLFAGALIMINRMQKNAGNPNKYGIWPFIILWVAISVIFGFMGSPDGNAVAWAAHLGGFFGGFAALKIMRIV